MLQLHQDCHIQLSTKHSAYTCLPGIALSRMPKATSHMLSQKACRLQVEKHDTRESSWFIHDGKVIDATRFLDEHPGGPESVLIVAGQDATDEFNAIHSAKAKGMLTDYVIGKVGESGAGNEAKGAGEAMLPAEVSYLAL